ncbi:choline transport protein, partial [Tremellales sp. Uapishka_1]
MSEATTAASTQYPLKGPYSHQVVNESVRQEQAHLGPSPLGDLGVDAEREGGTPPKHFRLLSLVGLAYAILNSWTAMAASLSIALPSGGPTAVIWGIVPSFIGTMAIALSLSEICHVYPTSGGQYHWTAILAPPKYAPILSWISGWFAVSGWVCLTASAGSLAGSLITGAYALLHDAYEFKNWHLFIVFLGYMLLAGFINIWGLRLLPLFNKTAIFWSLTGAVVIVIVCLSTASPNFQEGSFVFGGYINNTGWNDGLAWMLGLLQSAFGLAGCDAVTHMVEEMPEPHLNAPRTMILAVLIGAVSSWIFLVCLLFSITDVDLVNSSSAGALLESMYQATNSKAGAVCLQVFPIVCMAFTATALMTASSRMTQAFARDGGLPFSKFFARSNHNGVPVPAIGLTLFFTIAFGCVYLGSSAALNAILSASVVFLQISYVFPIMLVLIRGRQILRPPSLPEPTMTLGPIFGPICNIVR